MMPRVLIVPFWRKMYVLFVGWILNVVYRIKVFFYVIDVIVNSMPSVWKLTLWLGSQMKIGFVPYVRKKSKKCLGGKVPSFVAKTSAIVLQSR